MHLKQPLLFVLLFICLNANSQEKYIEVTVSDTVWVKPNQFVYTISVNPDALEESQDTTNGNFLYYRKKQRQLGKKQDAILDSVKLVLTKKGFFILPVSIRYAFTTDRSIEFNTVAVLTSSVDSVKALFNFVRDNPVLTGDVGAVFSTRADEYKAQLLKKLISKAQAKAAEIAKLSGIKAGNIISVKESPADDVNGRWTAYPPLSALSGGYRFQLMESVMPRRFYEFSENNMQVSDLYQLQNTITVRFAVQ